MVITGSWLIPSPVRSASGQLKRTKGVCTWLVRHHVNLSFAGKTLTPRPILYIRLLFLELHYLPCTLFVGAQKKRNIFINEHVLSFYMMKSLGWFSSKIILGHSLGLLFQGFSLFVIHVKVDDHRIYSFWNMWLPKGPYSCIISRRLCLGAWSDHGERTGGFYACNRYESAKQEGVVSWFFWFVHKWILVYYFTTYSLNLGLL